MRDKKYFTYVLYSKKFNKYYTGQNNNLALRYHPSYISTFIYQKQFTLIATLLIWYKK